VSLGSAAFMLLLAFLADRHPQPRRFSEKSATNHGARGLERFCPRENHNVVLAASTVAVVAIAAAIIVVALVVWYVLPRGGRRKPPPA
jgi:hypothetical protein